MTKIINYQLREHNKNMCDMFLQDATERNSEIFFAVGVGIHNKDLNLFYAHVGGIDRIIETMEHVLTALKVSQAKKKL